MTSGATISLPARRDPAVAAIVRSWRSLTGARTGSGRLGAGAPTLVACSGGADSSALLLALACAAQPGMLTVAHIVHDLRPAAEAGADRDATRELAAALGIRFVEGRVSVREAGGNAEGAARRLRYEALARLARENGARFIATGHQAGDQLETILMGLLRGSGPAGLAGVAPRRRLRGPAEGAEPVWVVRPMLRTAPADCRRICTQCGWAWREDATNADRSRLRAGLRHGVIPQLIKLRPGAEKRAAAAADLLRDAAGLVEDRADRLLARAESVEGSGGERGLAWSRDALRTERAIIVGSVLRRAAGILSDGAGMDRLSHASVATAGAAVRDARRDPRVFDWRGVEVEVTSRRVEVRRKSAT